MKEPVISAAFLPPSPSPRPLRFLIIGAGSRGTAYARAVTTATQGTIHAVAEPHPFKRQHLGRSYIWGEHGTPQDGQEFSDWRAWLQWEQQRREIKNDPRVGVDGVFICTLDSTHVEILHAIAPLQLHILCEKPLALSLEDCLSVYRALTPNLSTNIFSIGHVLRYSPHNILLRKLLLLDRVIGDIVSLEHTEPVGFWHFAHSYVRGNWRRETPNGDGSLLTKSCHDIDFIMWLLSSPPPSSDPTSQPIHPRTITSTGSLTQFRKSQKPPAAGAATNCLSCPAERDCVYSAVRIYNDMHVAKGDIDWPVNIVCEDIEDIIPPSKPGTTPRTNKSDPISTEHIPLAQSHLLARLREDYQTPSSLNTTTTTTDEKDTIHSRPWYGRCVYESDNTVCDDQTVTITFSSDPPKTALFHMIAPTEKQCERRGRVYGTLGEISYDSRTITIYSFQTRETTTITVPKRPAEEEKAHGGGDYGLARSFVDAVDAVVNKGWGVAEAQRRFVGCDLEEAVRSHAVVFAAEEARREEVVVKWGEWWGEKVRGVGGSGL